MKITVEIKSVFGTEKIYPACKDAQLFADIAGTKTLSRNVIAMIKGLGYTVAVKQDAPTEL